MKFKIDQNLPAEFATILQQASKGVEQTGGTLPAGANLGGLVEALKSSFVSGMHLALIVAGGVLLLAAVVSAVFVVGGEPQQVQALDKGATLSESSLPVRETA